MSIKSAISALSTKAKVIIGTAAVAVVGAAVAAAVLLSGGTDTYRVLKVFELDGSAVISREGTGELSAYVGMNLESGDTLTVGEGSTMRISMDNDKYVLLDEGTVLELTAEGSPADSRTSIKLVKGTILNELTSSLSANSSYEVSTPKSTMAVRGTSFLVSVVENEDGSYTITVQTFHGKVEVTLLDSEGRPTDKKVMLTEDSCIIIRTVVNEKTGNPAEIDGISFFAFEAGSDIYVEVPNGESPISGIDYGKLLALIKKQLLKSNDSGLLVLSDLVEGKLRGGASEDNPETQTTTTTTAASAATTTGQTASAPESEATTLLPPPETTADPVTAPQITAPAAATTTTTGARPAATTKETTASKTRETKPAATKETTVSTTEETTTTTAETTAATTTAGTTAATRPPYIPQPPFTTPDIPVQTTTTTAPTETTTTTTTTVPTETTTTTTETTPEPELFTVSFVKDGVTVYSEQVQSGATVTSVPNVPDKPGHTGEWYVGTSKFTADTVITGETTVEPKYTINTYTVTFVDEDGGTVDTRTADYNTAVASLPTVPTKTGYTGVWRYNGAEFTTTTKVTDNITVEAVYTINNYTVTFVDEDGTTVDTRTADYNTAVASLPAVPTKTGYTGIWKYNNSEFTTSTKVTDNITVEAVYTINNYTVTFVNEDGGTVDTRTADYNTAVASLPTVPAKTGYTGIWKYNNSEFTTTTKVTDNITVEAVYTINNYTVTFIASGFEKGKAYADYGTTVAESDIPAVPPKTGYTGKWVYSGGDFTSDTVIYGNTTVEAKYTINNYTVTFVDEDGGTVDTRTADYNTAVASLPTVPPKTGYTGVWKYNNSEFTTSTKVTDNITVEAVYTINNYTVTFIAAGFEEGKAYADYGATVAESDIPAVPPKTGYTGKWVYSEGDFTSDTVIYGNTTVEAKYTINNYTVTFTAEGSEDVTRNADYNTTVTDIPAVPTKTGYTGVWKYNNSEFTTSTKVTDNITVEAVYTINNYTVTFTAEGSEDVTRNADYNTTVTDIPAVPARTGYTNGKWMYNGSEFTSSIKITENITVTAEYTALYTVTYVLEADESVVILTQNDVPDGTVPEEVTLPVVLDTDSDGTYDYYLLEWTQPGDEITGNTTIPVKYELYNSVYQLKITDVGGTIRTGLVLSDTKITLPTAEEVTPLDNYTFVGWGYTNSGGYSDSNIKTGAENDSDSVDDYMLNITPAAYAPGAEITLDSSNRLNGGYITGLDNYKFFAVYKGNPMTVTFVDEDGGTVDTRTADYNTTVTDIPTVPTKTGYTGVWKYNGSEFTTTTEVTGNITVEPVYTINTYTVTYVLKCADTSETKELLKLEDVEYGAIPDAVALDVVVTTETNKYYLVSFTAPNQPISDDTTIYVNYELYDNVYQLKITDANRTITTGVVTEGSKITLPTAEEVTPLDNCTFVGWGYTNSGGYSDSNIKSGAENDSDSVDDYSLNTTPAAYAPGAEITLDSSNRLNGGYITGLDNYKFFAVYKGNSMTVTFVDEEGKPIGEIQKAYGDDFGKYEYEGFLTAKDGYTVVWYYNEQELTEYYNKVVGNMTIVGKYVPVAS